MRLPPLSRLLAAAPALLLLLACATAREAGPVSPDGSPPPPRPFAGASWVAVAPMENRSNDLDAAEVIRDAFVGGISSRGWAVMPVGESDRLLRERLGINYGGQLKTTDPGEVCRSLDVDGVFYGDVLEWNKTTTGIYNSVVVTAVFDLYGRDGARRWGGRERLVVHDVPRGGRDILAEMIVHAFGNLFLNPMTPHGEKVGRTIAAKVPPGALSLPPAADPGKEEGR